MNSQDSQSELKDELTSIMYGANWKTSATATAFKPDVEAAMKRVEAYVTTRVKEAERQGAENIINDLISKDAFAEDFEVKELLKTVRTALATTTNGKETK